MIVGLQGYFFGPLRRVGLGESHVNRNVDRLTVPGTSEGMCSRVPQRYLWVMTVRGVYLRGTGSVGPRASDGHGMTEPPERAARVELVRLQTGQTVFHGNPGQHFLLKQKHYITLPSSGFSRWYSRCRFLNDSSIIIEFGFPIPFLSPCMSPPNFTDLATVSAL